MFGALNRFISRLDSESPLQRSSAPHGGYGFQVLRNKDPELPIDPWFDFVIGINGRPIDDPDPHLFAQEVRNCAGASVTLGLWSAKGQRIRDLRVSVPSADLPSLGLTLQWTAISSTEDVWHILDVAPNSPAEQAGLLPYGDYIIGTPEGIVRGEAGLGELVEDHLSRPLELHIYNHEYDLTRPVTITPSRNWGGSGALGCVLGYGALHRLPVPLHEPPQAPGETLFETVGFNHTRPSSQLPPPSTSPSNPQQSSTSSNLLIPAEHIPDPITTSTPKHSSSSRKTHHRPAAAHHHHNLTALSPTRQMDEYFREGEAKSKELDHAPSSAKTSAQLGNLPPPPRMGGPPKVQGEGRNGNEKEDLGEQQQQEQEAGGRERNVA
ncbi:MAG: hypothetical protein M1816_007804 [Peltula sp. TS41687]|nr:MAG: hypothetical protein M1816_007804 [Peltula sp. TS41687]